MGMSGGPLPIVEREDFLFGILDRLSLRDGRQIVRPGPADLAILQLVDRLVGRPGTNLVLELPRGQHDVAILCGVFAKLAQIVSAHEGSATAAFSGPVVVVGMNTMVHERLRRIQLAGVTLEQGLVACRLRSDGKLVLPDGTVVDATAFPDALIYLNTRVGWPRLPRRVTPSFVVIDRTSFRSPEVLGKALAWAREHRAASVVVVADLGDEATEDMVRSIGMGFVIWPWSHSLLSTLAPMGGGTTESLLSTNVLCHGYEPAHAVALTAAAVDEAFRCVLCGLAEAQRVDAPWPRPLQLVRRIVYGLSRLLATVDEYNQWAALDYRTVALSTLIHDLEGRGFGGTFSGPWAPFGEGRWPEVRLDALRLYELVKEENPKLYALAYTLDRVASDHPGTDVIIRVPSEAGGLALEVVLGELVPEHKPNGTNLRCLPWSERLPWAPGPLVEIHPGALPPSRMPALWSAESSSQFYLAYPFEIAMLNTGIRRGAASQESAITETAGRLRMERLAPHQPQEELAVAMAFDVDPRRATRGLPVSVDLDVRVLFEPLDDESEATDVVAPGALAAGATVEGRALILEPDGWTWWIREGRQVEALAAQRMTYLPLGEVRRGTVVIVPRGEGREELFGRLVSAAHRSDTMQAFEVLFRRWRDACLHVYRGSGTWRGVEDRMREEGSSVTRQSPRLWALGTVIGPDDPEDVRRMGRLSGDTFIEG